MRSENADYSAFASCCHDIFFKSLFATWKTQIRLNLNGNQLKFICIIAPKTVFNDSIYLYIFLIRINR